ncbi:hypothetical protein KUTeg_015489 [Tegillarca granosa]|uniref:TOG domain-containing protein n=1 Tax=Tegillarca granosa TaxID=220873 RepID=A0ABQ9EUQ6_TEGGR|nr:hypothetical protein KUTeg_015489 [Tegillarca granosa]
MEVLVAPSRGLDDDHEFVKPLSTKVPQTRRAASSTSSSRKTSTAPATKLSTSSAGSTQLKRRRSISGAVSSSSGAVDEDFFIKSFEDVPKVQIYSSRDLQDHMNKARDYLMDTNNDWEKRNDHMKMLRGMLVSGAAEHDDFFQILRTLEPCLLLAVKDLRSQIVREACITIAYYSQQLGHKFDHFAESMMPALINLIPNSVKIMATSGIVCIRFLIQYTHTPRLIPVISGNTTSKSSIIRRYCYEFINQLLHTWPTHILEKHIANLQDTIKRGISDADAEARVFSRKAFWGFADHFKDQADALLNTLDASKQKMLQGELSGSSSNNSLNSAEGRVHRSRPRSASQDRGFDSSTLGRIGKKKHGQFSSARSDTGADLDKPLRDTNSKGHIVRSSSAVDLANGPRSYVSPKYRSPGMSAVSRMTPGATYSLPRQRSTTLHHHSVISPPERSRPRTKVGTSQSQPGSRSGSPASRLQYITHTGGRTDPMTPTKPRRSGIARSQGASREGSPSRVSMQPGRERRLSGGGSKLPSSASKKGVMAQRLLRPGSDVEDAITDALQKTGRKRIDIYDSDDAASETSSVCSERSYSSFGRTSEDTAEIISLLGSGSYADRKEGLIALQHLLRNNRYLNRVELRKVMEVFTRMFHDPHSKVLSLFLDTLVDLICVHSRDLNDQLYVLLTRLLNKTGADMLGSVHAKVQKALDAVRENFPCDHQFNILTKYIVDQTQSPNLKVKTSLLTYMHGLALSMDPSDFVNSSDSRLAISRIIGMTTEPKNVDVRKGAQTVLIALFNLNPPEFSMMLSNLPKAFQDSATKILHHHIRTASHSHETDVLSPRNVSSPQQNRSRPPSRNEHRDATETENMNPEDIYNSIKKTSADIQNLSFNSKLDNYDDVKKKNEKREFTSQDSGIQDLRNDSPDAGDNRKGHYNPSHYQDEGTLNGYNNKGRLPEVEFDDGELFNEAIPENELIAEILTELSNHNERNDQRKNAMLTLIKLTREGTFKLWDEHFKTVLLILLETLGDNDGHIRALALRVLREILRNQPSRFRDYAELTTLRILEAHKDSMREVVRSAEECADTLANYIPPEQSVRILNPIIQTAQYPINLAAIKMQNKVVELLPKETLELMLPEVIPGLLRGYDDQESTVRKSAVFCLVAIYLSVGDVIWNHLTKLNYSKVKLLNLYIKRAQQKEGNKGVTSPHSSDT